MDDTSTWIFFTPKGKFFLNLIGNIRGKIYYTGATQKIPNQFFGEKLYIEILINKKFWKFHLKSDEWKGPGGRYKVEYI